MLHLPHLSDHLIILAAGPLVVWGGLFAAALLMRLHSLPVGPQAEARARGALLSWNGALAICLIWMIGALVLTSG